MAHRMWENLAQIRKNYKKNTRNSGKLRWEKVALKLGGDMQQLELGRDRVKACGKNVEKICIPCVFLYWNGQTSLSISHNSVFHTVLNLACAKAQTWKSRSQNTHLLATLFLATIFWVTEIETQCSQLTTHNYPNHQQQTQNFIHVII